MDIKEKIVDKFLKSVLVIDTESTGLDPKTAEICEIGSVHKNKDGLKVQESLFGTEYPIPFAASAKNNISRHMLYDLPTFKENIQEVRKILEFNNKNIKYFVAHNFKYDHTILQESFYRSEDILGVNKIIGTKWICTYRLAQHLFEPSEENVDLSYSLNYLRYAFDLPVGQIGLHRAGDDCKTTFYLLKFIAEYVMAGFETEELTEDFDLGEMLFELSKSQIKVKVMPFGKWKGEKLEDVPDSYYRWMLEKSDMLDETKDGFNPDFAESVLEELNRRKANNG